MRPYYEEGGITIYHGDSAEVLRGLPAECVDSVISDPPYKISQQYSASADADNVLAVSSIWPVASESIRLARPGATAALFYDTRILPLGLQAMRVAGWKYLRNLTLYRRWGQSSKLLGWMSSSDFILIFAKPGAPFRFFGRVRHDVYIRSGPDPEYAGHPAQKPSDCVLHLVSNLTPPDGTVLDPYLGSGTTAIAAVRLGLKAICIEEQERFCELAAKRLAQGALNFADQSA